MADEGILIFEGMKVGVLPGDFTVEVNSSGSIDSKLILSTAYNVLPIWLRIAKNQLLKAKQASEAISINWGTSDETNRELLVAEIEPSLQIFVACGIVLDGLYDQLRPFAKLSQTDIQKWKGNRTGRAKQIAEVIRRVYKLNREETTQFKQNISEIIHYRDMAVHPSLELRRTYPRSDLPVYVDWKFSAYRYSNAGKCFQATLEMFYYLYTKKCTINDVDLQMENIVKALGRVIK